jgi:formate hydrogenlyase subunit 3/multisubunit Na+/H+ antiporter MnhD subunit
MIGLTMAIVGGVLAVAQRRLGRLIGYAALIDSGCALMALGLNSALGVTLVFLALLVRPVGLLLMAGGLSGVWARNRDDRLDALTGRGWRAPWSTAAFVAGGLSIAGWPLGAGFASRWAHVRALASSNPTTAVLTVLAGAATVTAVWRGAAVLMRRPRTAEGLIAPHAVTSEGLLTGAVVLVAIVASVALGLFPQLVGPVAATLAEGYTFFLP